MVTEATPVIRSRSGKEPFLTTSLPPADPQSTWTGSLRVHDNAPPLTQSLHHSRPIIKP